jgi:uncharacterized protein YcfL
MRLENPKSEIRNQRPAMFNRKKSLLLLPTLALALAACNPVPPPVEGREDPYGRRQIMFDSPELQNNTSVGAPQPTRDENGILHVAVPITATTSKPLNVEYRGTFYDGAGGVVNQTTWFRKRLTPRTTDSVSLNSTSPRAADFQIDFREAR